MPFCILVFKIFPNPGDCALPVPRGHRHSLQSRAECPKDVPGACGPVPCRWPRVVSSLAQWPTLFCFVFYVCRCVRGWTPRNEVAGLLGRRNVTSAPQLQGDGCGLRCLVSRQYRCRRVCFATAFPAAIVTHLAFCYSDRWESGSRWGLICTSLFSNGFEHLAVCLRTVCFLWTESSDQLPLILVDSWPFSSDLFLEALCVLRCKYYFPLRLSPKVMLNK